MHSEIVTRRAPSRNCQNEYVETPMEFGRADRSAEGAQSPDPVARRWPACLPVRSLIRRPVAREKPGGLNPDADLLRRD